MAANRQKDHRNDDPRSGEDRLRLSQLFVADQDSDAQKFEAPPPAGLAGMIRKLKKNSNLVTGIAAGALLLLIVLFFGWYLGWFSGNETSAPAGAEPPPQFPAQAMPPPNLAELPKPFEQKPPELPKTDEPKKENLPLPEDVAKWKKEDYFRARKENHPKLLEAVFFLGEKFRGSAPAAQGLTDLLKPLPAEPPPAAADATPSAPGAISPAPGAMPSAPGAMPPPGATPPMLGPRLERGPMPPMPGMRPEFGPTPLGPGSGAMPPVAVRPNQADLTKLVETIIVALGENGSDLAVKTLEQILSGVLTTDDDKAAVEAALKALAAHPRAANDALLLRVLVAPEVLRPADRQGPWPVKDLWTKAFELIKPAASSGLRAKLAEALADRTVKREAAEMIREFVLAPDPLNCAAQQVFYEKAATTKEIKIRLEQQLGDYSATALARLLGIPTGTEAGAGGSAPVPGGYAPAPGRFGPDAERFGPAAGGFNPAAGGFNPTAGGFNPAAGGFNPAAGPSGEAAVDLGPRLAGLLWSEKFRVQVESQLAELRLLEKQPQLVLLAATIPQDSTRAALAKLLRKRWIDGPKALETAGLPDRVHITDPGLLVLVKMLPRKENKAARGLAGAAPRAARQPAGGRAADALTLAQKKEQAEQDWMALSAKLVAALCKQFRTAALAKQKAAEESDNPPAYVPPKLPGDFELGRDAKVIASYHVLWPDEAPAAMSDQKPSLLEIHYILAEQTGIPKKVFPYYCRQVQARTSDSRIIDKATWFDSMRTDSKADRKRSVDLLITRSNENTVDAAKDDQETDHILEILSIEIKDPASRE